MTPGRLQSYIAGALDGGGQDDGLLQRFQVAVWPEVGGEWANVDRYPNTEAKNAAFGVFQALDKLDPTGIGATAGEVPYLRFAVDAQDLFDEWRANLERRLRTGELSDTPAFESHLAKYRSLMPSMALIFHLVDVVSGKAAGPVSVEAASIAADWCGYLEAHARKMYAPELNPDLAAAHRLAAKIRSGDIQDGMTIRDIYRPQWSGLTNTDTVCAGLELLIRHNWLRVIEQGTGGRPSDIIEIHSSLRKAEA
jgi:putative DNA primase/helicase